MDQYEIDTLKMFNKINKNSTNTTKKFEEASQRSKNKQPIQYGKRKKKKNKINVKIAITAIVLTATMAAGISHNLTTTHIENNNAVISTAMASNIVDESIEQYMQKMNMYANKEDSIETYLGRIDIEDINEANVDYTSDNIKNLAKHITEAAKVSESETRCAVIAAYKIINEPYRDNVLGKALKKASEEQEDNSNYVIPSTVQEFLEKSGYENWEEYQLNERENIKDLKAAEEYVGGKNR